MHRGLDGNHEVSYNGATPKLKTTPNGIFQKPSKYMGNPQWQPWCSKPLDLGMLSTFLEPMANFQCKEVASAADDLRQDRSFEACNFWKHPTVEKTTKCCPNLQCTPPKYPTLTAVTPCLFRFPTEYLARVLRTTSVLPHVEKADQWRTTKRGIHKLNFNSSSQKVRETVVSNKISKYQSMRIYLVLS